MDGAVFFEETPPQERYVKAALSGEYKFLLFGGAMRSGKTYIVLALIILLCKIFPKSRWAVVRKTGPLITGNVFPVFEKLKPPGFFLDTRAASQNYPWHTPAVNGSQIIWWPEFTSEGDQDMNRWRGLEVNGFVLEEASELFEKTFTMCIARAGAYVMPRGYATPPPLILLTCNPSQSWVKKLFYDPFVRGELKAPWFYQPAFPGDNPYLDPVYVEGLKHMPEKQYKLLVEGNWDYAETPDQLIQASWIAKAYERWGLALPEQMLRDKLIANPNNHFLGVDVARFGDDDSVIAHRIGHMLYDMDSRHGWDTVEVAKMSADYALRHKIPQHRILVDAVGVGGGVVDNLKHHHKLMVESFIAGASPTKELTIAEGVKFQFANLRAEGWWTLRELFDPETPGPKISINPRLMRQGRIYSDLTAVKYEISSDKMVKITPKKQTKMTAGQSPDYGDAIMQAFCPTLGANVTERLANLGRLTELFKGAGGARGRAYGR